MRNTVGDRSVFGQGRVRRWLASISALSTTTLSLASFGALVAPLPATAADHPTAVTSVSTTAPSVSNGSPFQLDFVWSVPNNTPAGDTFSIALPTALNNTATTPFVLLAPYNVTPVANCVRLK